MKKKIVLPLAALILAAVAFTALFLRGRGEDDTIRFHGNIEATDVELSFRVPGRIIERPASEGQPIAAGAIVARLDETDNRTELAAREGELAAARAALRELEAGFRREEVAQAEAVVRAAEAEASRTAKELERQEGLYQKDVISRRELEVAQSQARTAQEKWNETRQRLALLARGPRQEQIEQAAARVQSAEAAVLGAQTRVGYTTLTSPISGWVLAEHVEAGEQVNAGTPIVTVADLQNVWLRAWIDQSDLGKVRLGQAVNVTTDSFPGKIYKGRISFISPEAEFTPRAVQTQKERVKLVYRTRIQLENPALELKPGMPADGVLADRQAEQ